MKTLHAARTPTLRAGDTSRLEECAHAEASTREWSPSNPEAWKYQDKMNALIKSEAPKQGAQWAFPFCKPLSVSMLQQVMVSDFRFSARVQCSNLEFGNGEMGVVFGYQDAAHYYYVHLCADAEAGGSKIFIVNGTEWKPLSLKSSTPSIWSDGAAHRVRIERNTMAGEIRVYVDDSEIPELEALDRTYLKGLVGVGTPNGKSLVDQVDLKGVSAR